LREDLVNDSRNRGDSEFQDGAASPPFGSIGPPEEEFPDAIDFHLEPPLSSEIGHRHKWRSH